MTPDSPFLHSEALQDALFRAIRSALGLSAHDADARVIRAYADQPAQEPDPRMNLCYYHLQADPNTAVPQEFSMEDAVPAAYSFIPCSIQLVFYGPDSEAWARRCRSFLYLDGHGSPRAILRSAGLYPIPSPRMAADIWEETGKAFRKRADLVIEARLAANQLYAAVDPSSSAQPGPIPVGTVSTPPESVVHLPDGHA